MFRAPAARWRKETFRPRVNRPFWRTVSSSDRAPPRDTTMSDYNDVSRNAHQYVTAEQAAHRLGISEAEVLDQIAEGTLPAVEWRRAWVIHRDHLPTPTEAGEAKR